MTEMVKRVLTCFLASVLIFPLFHFTTVNAAASGDIRIDAAHFPDEEFRKYILEEIDPNHDGLLTQTEISKVDTITVCEMGVTSLKGIEYFTELTDLACPYNQLTTLDVSHNTALESLDCSDNRLTGLNLANNKELLGLVCPWNNITSLDVSQNVKLISLSCDGNSLVSLDVSGNNQLHSLSCSHNQLRSLELGTKQFLRNLSCSSNSLDTLDISGCPKMIYVFFNHNMDAGTADESGNPKEHHYINSDHSYGFRLDLDTEVVTFPQLKATLSTLGAKLSWTGIAHAQKYEIYRKEGTGNWKVLQTVTNNNYTDKTCLMGTQYSYRMRANVDSVWTKYTDLVTITFNPFRDVSLEAWYYSPVKWAYNQGVTAGTSETAFEPNKTCTRAEFVTFLYKLMGKPWDASWASECHFSDVKSSDWYYRAVVWANHAGVTHGTGNGQFSPNVTLDRAMVISFLYNMEKYKHGEPTVTLKKSKFTDVLKTAYYYTPVLWAEQYKITNGTSATTFDPAKKCTRAEAVTFIYNLNNYWNK